MSHEDIEYEYNIFRVYIELKIIYIELQNKMMCNTFSIDFNNHPTNYF